jgi:hypothetical protein
VTTRVIQWATGPVGSVQLAEVIDNPEFDLVGLFVYSPDKVGVDAGALVRRPDTGIIATNDKAAILALEADVVLHSASKAYGFDGNTDDIVALLETGKSVITVTSVLVVEEFWTCTPDIPDWDQVLDGHTVRVRVDGVPNIAAEVRVDTDPIAHFSNISGGFVAVGISALRAIPYVLKAPAGIVVPEVFGAYRWPGAPALT